MDKKTFCVAPWYNLYINADKTISPCCEIRNHGQHQYEQLDEYYHSPRLQKLRQDLINGVRNKDCAKCWNNEDAGGKSLRQIHNATWGASGTKFKDLNKPDVSDINSFDLVLGNLCNLKCTMCWPGLSSQLHAEVQVNPALGKLYGTKYLPQSAYNWPKERSFVDWCGKHLPNSILIKFTGGEPFITPWIDQVIDTIPDAQKSKCTLHFTSNLTVLDTKVFDHFKKFKEVWLSVSVEGIGETFEYVRYGHKWNTLTENIKKVRDMQIKNLYFNVNHVVQATSFHSILPMTKYFDDLEMMVHPVMLNGPKQFHVSALTEKAKKEFLEKTKNYKGHNKNFIDYVRDISEKFMAQDTTLAEKFVSHLATLDKVRKNNHSDIIPIDNIR
jgi:sulfatase maturation enzyme AslB (radical SAM superfamily)